MPEYFDSLSRSRLGPNCSLTVAPPFLASRRRPSYTPASFSRGIVASHAGSTAKREMFVPIYEYTCSACGAACEHLIRSKNDQSKLVCPSCGSRRLERRLSVIASPRMGAKTASPAPSACDRCGEMGGACPYR